jgi:predicted ATPase
VEAWKRWNVEALERWSVEAWKRWSVEALERWNVGALRWCDGAILHLTPSQRLREGMITRLYLEQFRSFQQAELFVDDLTLLVGTNASGKSNVRDALRFLHGIGRGYTLAEIIGGVYRNGIETWSGMRGGSQSLAFNGSADFLLGVSMTISHDQTEKDVHYQIRIAPGSNGAPPKILHERLEVIGEASPIFMTGSSDTLQQVTPMIFATENKRDTDHSTGKLLSNHQPVLSQWSNQENISAYGRQIARSCMALLQQMRFLDFNPDMMRQPSLPGQTVLSDHGENLSSVLQHLCKDPQQKAILMSWLEELTPMDAADLVFRVDATGKVVLTLVEQDGRETLAFNASDGTLRFLAFLATLLGQESKYCYVVEEIEHGIHPTRLYLLLELIQRQASQKKCQVIATTHSPQVLLMVRQPYLESISLTYRLQEAPDTRIIRILDLPDAQRLIESQDIGRLHETGWFENAADFVASQEVLP